MLKTVQITGWLKSSSKLKLTGTKCYVGLLDKES